MAKELPLTYAEKLRNPRWQKKRLEIFKRDEFKCRLCGDTETELHLHHIEYLKDTEPYDYPDDLLITYCKHCHLIVEYHKNEFSIIKLKKIESDVGKICIFQCDNKRICFATLGTDNAMIPYISLRETLVFGLKDYFKKSNK